MDRQATQRVDEVMTRTVETISPDVTIQEAAQKMEAADVGPLPVVEGDRVVGILTDRDVITRAVSEGRDPQTHVRDIMTTDVVSCVVGDDVREVARRMQEAQLKRLVVLDPDHRLVGIVSLADLPVGGV